MMKRHSQIVPAKENLKCHIGPSQRQASGNIQLIKACASGKQYRKSICCLHTLKKKREKAQTKHESSIPTWYACLINVMYMR